MRRYALVAQLDRVLDYESRGQGFESLRARHINASPIRVVRFYFILQRDSNPERVSPVKITVRWTVFRGEVRRGYAARTQDTRRKPKWLCPFGRAKKEVTFVYQKLLLFLSKPQAWHIITRQRVYHRRRRISSAEGCIACGMMRYNTSC